MRVAFVAALIPLALALGACAPEERVVRYRPFFTGLPNAEFGTDPIQTGHAIADPTASGGDSVVEDPDGSRKLVCRNIYQLMQHIQRELMGEDDDIIYDQLVAEEAKEEFRDRDEDPRNIVAYLREHQKQIAILFNKMPMAERSPTVVTTKQGPRRWRLRLQQSSRRGSTFDELWVVMEHGEYKLLWVK